MRILTILGTRPEAIKLMPVIKELENAKMLNHAFVQQGNITSF